MGGLFASSCLPQKLFFFRSEPFLLYVMRSVFFLRIYLFKVLQSNRVKHTLKVCIIEQSVFFQI